MKTIEEMPATCLPADREERTGQDWLSRAALHGGKEKSPCARIDDLDDGVVPIGVAVVMLLKKV